ncbi:DUF475 domain-containing protein [Psychrobacter sp. CAL346-MNA-CIBAN-0220]|uniref:DUF475 domain-containing protein n=1 Tax=Psychrobacter sp. CAL346-MNA-CIBAN-0220 TaxID=3140457 RepID=UPI0033324F40
MRHFYLDFIFTAIALMVAAWWGYSHGGMGGMISTLSITAILAVMEISLSFDNAVVNASVLKHWDEFWKKIFLTVGILIAVFGMRLVFPIVIVAVTADLGMMEVINLALNDPKEYSLKLLAHHAEISAFGGMFLLLVFLNFVFDDKDVHWFDWLESRLAKLGKVNAMSVFVALAVLMISLTWVSAEQSAAVLVAGVWGILIYLGVQVISGMLEGDLEEELENEASNSGAAAGSAIMKGGIIGFLYLEVLDASFSFDGVIGAFAITNDVIVIMLGLAIGAMFVRSMTIFLVDKGTLDEFIYLEHGAHYAIGALAVIMLLSMKFHVPELITGLVGIAFIGWALLASLKHRKQEAKQII